VTLENGTLPTPATFNMSPEVPDAMVTLSTVPLTYVLMAVVEGTPSTVAFKL
jgi:hypothetical protein